MASVSVTPGYVWASGETVTPTKLNSAASPTATATLADGEVTNAKLASDLDASKLTTGTLPADRIGAGAITTARIGTGAVTAGNLSTGAVGTGVGYVRQAASNYVIMQGPNGTRIAYAWGTSGTTSQQALSPISFPITFSSAPAVTATVTGVLFGFARFVSTGTVGTTGFDYQVRDNANAAQNQPIQWMAIGPVA